MRRYTNKKESDLTPVVTQKMLAGLSPSENVLGSATLRKSSFESPTKAVRKGSFASEASSSNMNRPAVMAPTTGSKHKDWNRLKYYSKLRSSMMSNSLLRDSEISYHS